MSMLADGLFDWDEAVIRIAVIIAIPVLLVVVGWILNTASKRREK